MLNLCRNADTVDIKHLLVPWVLVTKVLPRLRMLNMAGALTSYQSFLENGSTLQKKTRMEVKYVWKKGIRLQANVALEPYFHNLNTDTAYMCFGCIISNIKKH